jgi:hypothetical protein
MGGDSTAADRRISPTSALAPVAAAMRLGGADLAGVHHAASLNAANLDLAVK